MAMADLTETKGGEEADVEDSENDETVNGKFEKSGMLAMGDIISKILEKPIKTKTPILSKSKRTKKRKAELKEELETKKVRLQEKNQEREKNHVIPTRSNVQQELLLKRIATKGVVKLFNAVSSHQKTLSEKMKTAKTESKKTKAAETVTKSSFMDLLKQKKCEKNQGNFEESDDTREKSNKRWSVLQEDFMLGASMKDWDKEENLDSVEEGKDNVQEDDESENSTS